MKRILIIEPDRRMATSMQQYLSASCEVAIVHDSQAAIHWLDDHKVDLIILEPMIAQHNGIEFLYELRSYDDFLGVPLMIYGNVSSEQLGLTPTVCRQLGIQQVLYKPRVSLKELQRTVEELEVPA